MAAAAWVVAAESAARVPVWVEWGRAGLVRGSVRACAAGLAEAWGQAEWGEGNSVPVRAGSDLVAWGRAWADEWAWPRECVVA